MDELEGEYKDEMSLFWIWAAAWIMEQITETGSRRVLGIRHDQFGTC